MNISVMKRLKVMTLFAVVVMTSAGALANDNLAARFQSVEKLIEGSSAAQQIEASGDSAALAGREEARAHLEKARLEQDAGDLEAAGAELTLATQTMFQAVRMADQEEVLQDKKMADFRNRQSTITALLEAHSRVTGENGNASAGKELQNLVEQNLHKANQLVEQGKVDEGRQLLDETYVVTKMAVESIRGGETLVRSLNFANKEEEYHYELDRNDTHLMLVKVLLDDKMKDARISKQAQPFLQEAHALRERAEQEAGKGDYEDAVVTLEESTRQVTRAIRMAGIFIPG